MGSIHFLNPEFFWLFLTIPVVVAWYWWRRKQQRPTILVSNLKGFQQKQPVWTKWYPALFILRLLALCCIIVALARPRTVDINSRTKSTHGIDIVMSIDVSGSMLAKDLKPNRLESLKKVATEFVKNRPNDRFGVVVYAGESYTRTPVTSDKTIILDAIRNIKYSTDINDGTAIGMGLATAINRLKDSEAKSKVIILLTDGVNNGGFIEPETASEMAREFGIKVYTIGIGTNGMAEFPVDMIGDNKFIYRMLPVEIDETLLRSIAKNTDGLYFRATSNKKLEEIYEEINKLETSEIEELKFYNYTEKYRPWLLIALIILCTEWCLRQTLFRGIE